jgi:putative acetyltransferase
MSFAIGSTGRDSVEFTTGHEGREAEIVALFAATFTASEGEREGALIGDLVRSLLGSTAEEDLFVFTADEGGIPIGGIVFSRLTYPQDERTVFILAPVAVTPARQGRGVAQQLLEYGLAALRGAGIDIVLTYGDPGYYARVGFSRVCEADAQPPLPLKQPEGWLAKSLTGSAMIPLQGPSRCVEALDDPAFW